MTTVGRAYGAGLLAFALLGACGSRSASSGQADASATTDGAGQYAPDGAPWCPGPLTDAGFSSRQQLPVASLCAESGQVVYESKPCQGIIEVMMPMGDCGNWWLFDVATRALVAEGFNCSGTMVGCTGAAPGLQFPYQCFDSFQSVNICPDDAGVLSDASPDATD